MQILEEEHIGDRRLRLIALRHRWAVTIEVRDSDGWHDISLYCDRGLRPRAALARYLRRLNEERLRSLIAGDTDAAWEAGAG